MKKLNEVFQKNRRSFCLWGALFLALILIAVFRPSGPDIKKSRILDFNAGDTANVLVAVTLPKYRYDALKKEADDQGLTPEELLIFSYVNKSNIENIREIFNGLKKGLGVK